VCNASARKRQARKEATCPDAALSGPIDVGTQIALKNCPTHESWAIIIVRYEAAGLYGELHDTDAAGHQLSRNFNIGYLLDESLINRNPNNLPQKVPGSWTRETDLTGGQ
jgi:hypothetical protein